MVEDAHDTHTACGGVTRSVGAGGRRPSIMGRVRNREPRRDSSERSQAVEEREEHRSRRDGNKGSSRGGRY